MGFFSKILGKEPKPYSKKWFKSLSDAALDNEREKVRKVYSKAGNDINKYNWSSTLLNLFDNESDRRYRKRHPSTKKTKSNYRWTDANRWDKD